VDKSEAKHSLDNKIDQQESKRLLKLLYYIAFVIACEGVVSSSNAIRYGFFVQGIVVCTLFFIFILHRPIKSILIELLILVLIGGLSVYAMKQNLVDANASFSFKQLYLEAQEKQKRHANSVLVDIKGYVEQRPSRRKPGEIVFKFRVLEDEKASFYLLLSAPDVPWKEVSRVNRGDFISAQVRIYLPEVDVIKNLPSPLSYQGYLLRRGVSGRGKIEFTRDIVFNSKQFSTRDKFVLKLLDKFRDGDSLAIILAVVIGERDLVGEIPQKLFRETGTSHLLVVSGFHVGVVFMLFYTLSMFVIRRVEKVILHVPAKIPSLLIALVASSIYTYVTGGALTTIRALFVVLVFAIGEMLGRKGRALNTLCLAVLIVLFIWPGCFFELGFQLTFSALLGLHAVYCILRLKKSKRHTLGKKVIHFFISTFFYSAGAWLYTSPILLLWFNSIVPLAPVINTVVTPIFCLLCICLGGISVIALYLSLPGSHFLMSTTLRVVDFSLLGFEDFHHLLSQTIFGYHVLEDKHANIVLLLMLAIISGVIIKAYVDASIWVVFKRNNEKKQINKNGILSTINTLPPKITNL
jgi:ComEC/Rec2-related protein